MTLTVATAIPVPEPHARELRQARREFGDPEAKSVPTHVTLLGPTEVDEPTLRAYADHLERVAAAHQPFEVHLRGTASFRPVSDVVFVALVHGISSCERLATDVRDGPVAREHDYPYHPHVTVAQDLSDDALDRAFTELADYEARFAVPGFTLYRHLDGEWCPYREFRFAV